MCCMKPVVLLSESSRVGIYPVRPDSFIRALSGAQTTSLALLNDISHSIADLGISQFRIAAF